MQFLKNVYTLAQEVSSFSRQNIGHVLKSSRMIKFSSQCVNKQKDDAETLTNTTNKRTGQV
jgi:hypothetical protein